MWISSFQGARGEICGGFSDVPWGKTNTKGHYIPSEKAFLFTLSNNQDVPPTKYDIVKKMFAICYHPEWVPVFHNVYITVVLFDELRYLSQ